MGDSLLGFEELGSGDLLLASLPSVGSAGDCAIHRPGYAREPLQTLFKICCYNWYIRRRED
jgi:hypothetical protein